MDDYLNLICLIYIFIELKLKLIELRVQFK